MRIAHFSRHSRETRHFGRRAAIDRSFSFPTICPQGERERERDLARGSLPRIPGDARTDNLSLVRRNEWKLIKRNDNVAREAERNIRVMRQTVISYVKQLAIVHGVPVVTAESTSERPSSRLGAIRNGASRCAMMCADDRTRSTIQRATVFHFSATISLDAVTAAIPKKLVNLVGE